MGNIFGFASIEVESLSGGLPTFEAREPIYRAQLFHMEIRDAWWDSATAAARQVISGKDKYKEVADTLNKKHGSTIPWQFIGVIHKLEGDCDFRTHLHNGDSLRRRTVNVPAGRPKTGTPPFGWVESAIDALEMRNIFHVDKWPMERICYELEGYNGWGYVYHDIPSPYLWSGSNIYTKGKYTSDGHWDSEHVSQQIGAMVILSRILQLDATKEEVISSSTSSNTLNQIWAWVVSTAGGLFTFDKLSGIPAQVKEFEMLGISAMGWTVIALIIILFATIQYIFHTKNRDFKAGTYTPSNFVEKKIDMTEHVL